MLPVELMVSVYQETPLSTSCIFSISSVFGRICRFLRPKRPSDILLCLILVELCLYSTQSVVFWLKHMSQKGLYFEDTWTHSPVHPCMVLLVCLTHFTSHLGQFSTSLQSQCCSSSLVLFTPSFSHFSPLRHHFHTALLVSKKPKLRGAKCLGNFCSQLSI